MGLAGCSSSNLTQTLGNWWNASVTGFKSEGVAESASRFLDGLPVGVAAVGALGAIKGMGATAKKGVAVTDDAIRAALKGSELKTAQGAISRPAVENYVRRLEAGEVAPAIRVDGRVIVDGNHRYVAGRIVGKEPAQTAGTLSPSQAGRTQPIQNVKIDPSDWGNRWLLFLVKPELLSRSTRRHFVARSSVA